MLAIIMAVMLYVYAHLAQGEDEDARDVAAASIFWRTTLIFVAVAIFAPRVVGSIWIDRLWNRDFLELDSHATRKWCIPSFINTLNNIWTSLHEPLKPVMYDLCRLEKDAEYLMNEIDQNNSKSIEVEEIHSITKNSENESAITENSECEGARTWKFIFDKVWKKVREENNENQNEWEHRRDNQNEWEHRRDILIDAFLMSCNKRTSSDAGSLTVDMYRRLHRQLRKLKSKNIAEEERLERDQSIDSWITDINLFTSNF